MKRLIPHSSNSNLRVFIACLLSFMILMAPIVPVAASIRPTASPASKNSGAKSKSQPASDAKTESSLFKSPSFAPVVAPITATKTDSFADADADGKAELGETITYTVGINNNSASDATNVNFSDLIDPNTTFVPGSLKVSPLAFADSYSAAKNTTLNIAAPGVLANDTGMPLPTVVTPSTGATTAGGTRTVNSDGSFIYNPPSGFTGTDTFTYTVTNGQAPNDTATVTITVFAAPTAVADAYSTTSNTPVTISAPGVLGNDTLNSATISSYGVNGTEQTSIGTTTPTAQAGSVTLNADGSFTYTPATSFSGTDTFKYTISNFAGTSSATVTLSVNQAPTITSGNSTTFQTGQAGTFTVTTTGFPTGASMVITKTGTLPSGVTFTDNGNGTATLAGTPAAGTGGTYPITITANNGVAPNATQNFTLTVNQSSAITSANNTTFKVGTAGTFTVTTTGFPTATITETGALPSGVTFTDNGNGTATLAGTPDAATGGTYPITITAHNSVGSDATQSFTLTVQQAPAVTSANNTTFKVGTAGTFTVTTTGFPTVTTITKTGTLPSGVTFTDNGNGTATLAGTPAAATGGTYPITITASNGVTPNGTQSFTLTVQQPPVITSANNTTFKVGTAGTFTVTTTGFPTGASMVITKTGTLPSGVTFTDNGNGTATLAGTPDAATGGTYPITITASNGVTPDASQNFTLTVQQAPAVTSANAAIFQTGQAGTFSVTTSGFPTVTTITKTGTLPSGVTFTDNGNGTATLAGTPAAGTGGTYPITITASNGVTPNGTQNFTLTVNQPPAFTSANTATFNPGVAGTFNVTASGFPNNSLMAFSETGTLPGGVTFTDNHDGTATLAGTPAAHTQDSSPYNLNFTASNGISPDATQPFTLNIVCLPITITGTISTQTYNTAMTPVTFTQSGAHGTITWSATGLPTGITINSSTGQVSGTPSVTGNFNATITATDQYGCAGSKLVSFSVVPKLIAKTYTDVGNTQLVGGVAAPATPSVSVVPVSNGDTSDTTITYAVVTPPAHGALTVFNSDGTFLYTPNPGNTTQDTFTYSGTSNGATAQQTATVNFNGLVWYVNNTNAGTADGRSNTPFTTMTQVNSASTSTGDFIYVYKGSGTTTGAYTMKASQQLIGAGATLNAGGGLVIIPGNAATNTPTLGGTITLANSVTVTGMDMSTGASDALVNTGAAATGITVTPRTVTSTTGIAININPSSGTGTGTLTFQAVNANGGSKGIVLHNFTGTFTINGSGSTAGSGGTIQSTSGNGIELVSTGSITLKNMNLTNTAQTNGNTPGNCLNGTLTAAGTANCTAGLFMSSVATVLLDNVVINGTKQYGINGINVSGLTIQNGTKVQSAGDEAGEGGVFFQNLTGTATVSNFTALNNVGAQFEVDNIVAGSLTINVTNGIFNGLGATNTNGNQGFYMHPAAAGANITANVNSTNFFNNHSYGLQGNVDNGGHLTMNVGVTAACKFGDISGGAVVNDNSNGISFATSNGASQIDYDIENNSFNGNDITNFSLNQNATVNSSSHLSGTFANNTIGTAGIANSGASNNGDGMTGNIHGPGTFSMNAHNNTIKEVTGMGFDIVGDNGAGGNTTLKIFSNNITPSAVVNGFGIFVQAGTTSGGAVGTFCANIGAAGANTVNGTWNTGTGPSIRVISIVGSVFGLQGYSGAPTDVAAVGALLTSQNNGASAAARITSSTTSGSFGPGSCALLLSSGGILAAVDAFSLLTSFNDGQLLTSNSSAPVISRDSFWSPSTTASASLNQQQLDSIVSAAIQRWSATGLTPQQVATLHSIKFDVANLSGSYLGEANGNHVLVDRNAGGQGWYIGSNPLDDSDFAHAVSSTHRFTDPTSAPAGHVDLLTAIMHEIGHRLGLDDTYSQSERDNVMYGYLTVGERRLPARSQAQNAVLSNNKGTHFLTFLNAVSSALMPSGGTVSASIGTLPAGKSVTITFQVTVNNTFSGATQQVSNQGTITADGGISVLTDDTGTGANAGETDPTVTPVDAQLALTVNTLGDAADLNVGDRACDTDPAPGDQCTLRAAIQETNFSSTDDVIDFAPALSGNTITLDNVLPAINGNLVITGLGANLLTVDRNNTAATNFSVFQINSGKTVSISGLTISGGNSTAGGGGINNSGTLTLRDSTINGNSALFGGGIYSVGDLTISNSTFTDNHAVASEGGGIDSEGGTLSIVNSTISGNTAATDGGGLLNCGSSTTTLTNVTITDNRADNDSDNNGSGGGIAQVSSNPITLKNTIVAGNYKGASPSTTADDISGTVDATSSNNLIGTGGAGGLTGGGATNNQVGVSDARLAPLANNGGATKTHALLAGSPALDAGDNALVVNPPFSGPPYTDQRGTGFARIVDADDTPDTTATVDIGAFEAQVAVSDIPDTGTNEDTAASISFNVSSGISSSDVTATSGAGDQTLVPNANISVTGASSPLTLNITPASNKFGSATITVTVTSGGQSMTDTFVLQVTPIADTPSVTNSTTTEDTQTTTGLVISRNANDGSEVSFFKITNIQNGTLFQFDGVTPIVNDQFISYAEGHAGLKFTPTPNFSGTGSFDIQASTGNNNAGLGGSVITAMISVGSVNDQPTLDPITPNPLNILEDAGAQTVNLTGISAGGGESQTLTVTATSNNTGLIPNPTVSYTSPNATGSLSFSPVANQSGSATITVTVQDNGGTVGGGVDTVTRTFVVNVTAVNDAPSFTKGPNQTVGEDAGAQTVPNWATAISAGPGESGQAVNFVVTNNTNTALFSAQPAISPTGTLSYTPAANAIGSANITIALHDDGGTSGGGQDTSATQTFSITVNAVNDAPSFTKGPDQTVNEDAGAQSVPNWATAISAGPPDESGQAVNFIVTNNTNTALFSSQPAISPTGTLSYTPAANANGAATITIALHDNGGTSGGGQDTSATQTFVITVNAVNDAPTLDPIGNLTINEDAGAQTVNLTGISAGGGESQTLTVTATSNNTGLIPNPTVSYTSPNATGSLSFSPVANQSGSALITVTVNDGGGTANGGVDNVVRTFTVTVNGVNDAPVNNVPGPQGATRNGQLVFSAANSNLISISDIDAGAAAVKVTLTATNGKLTLSGTSGLAFTVGDGTQDTTMTFTGTIVNINAALNGLIYEPNNGYDGPATLQIITDDQGNTGSGGAQTDSDTISITVNKGGALGFSSATYTVAENAGSITITVNRLGGSNGTTKVDYATSNGTATAPQDYTATSGQLTFNNGETAKTFVVPIINDALNEASETVNLTLSNAQGSGDLGTPITAVLTITDNDPTPTLSINDVSVTEGNSGTVNAVFTVTLSAQSGQTVTVNYQTANGTATAPGDYTAIPSTVLTFTPGQTTKTITVAVNGDTTSEADETFFVNLSGATNATLADNQGQGTIVSDDSPLIQLNASSYSVAEDGLHATVTVDRLGDVSHAATVDYATSDPSGLTNCSVINGIASSRCDYAVSVGTLRFAANEASRTISIPIVNDVYVEGPENFTITLSNQTGGELGTTKTATVTINDNDNAGASNPYDDNAFFIRQLYIDLLGREPDPPGLRGWLAILNNCPADDVSCDRVHIAEGFARSDEFAGRGYLIYRIYRASFGRKPDFAEFIPDMAKVSGFLNAQDLEANKQAFVDEFVTRTEFRTRYDSLDNIGYVNALEATSLVTLPNKQALIDDLAAGRKTRAQVLRAVIETTEVYTKYVNEAFVVMEYFGFLRRDPDALYKGWIEQFNHSNIYRLVISGFVFSQEYRQRFGPN